MGQSDLYSDLSSDLSSDLRFCYLPMFAQNIHKALHIPVDLMKTWVLGGVPYIYIYAVYTCIYIHTLLYVFKCSHEFECETSSAFPVNLVFESGLPQVQTYWKSPISVGPFVRF